MTILEIMVASVLAALIIGGTMSAFLTAAMLSRKASPNLAEAALLAQQTVDRFRNRIACDDAWFNASTCQGQAQSSTSDPILPSSSPLLTAPGGDRVYEMVPVDINTPPDGVPDYYEMKVKVCWNTAGPCQ